MLGPILFSLYTTHLGRIIDHHGIPRHHFADDSQLYKPFHPDDPTSVQRALDSIQACSTDIKQWMRDNKLKLNDDKSEALLSGSSLSRSKVNISTVRVADADIPLSKTVKDLGVIIDSELTMVNHISATVKTCFYYIRLLGRLRPYINQSIANTIAVSLVQSRLDYCNSLLHGLPDLQLDRLQHVQNVAARIVTRSRKRDHITPVLKQLHWLPLHLRIQHKVLSLAYSCKSGTSPPYLSELIPSYVPSRSLRSASQCRINIPGYHDNTQKKQSGARSFKAVAPSLWNPLPLSLKSSPSAESFRRSLKTHLFSQF